MPLDLDQEKYISLATYRRDGREVRTPVWFAQQVPGTLYCFSAAGAGKIKRLRRSGSAQVAVCDVRGKVTGDWLNAAATIVSDPHDISQAYDLLLHKYGWQMRITNLFSWLSGRIRHRAVIRIAIS